MKDKNLNTPRSKEFLRIHKIPHTKINKRPEICQKSKKDKISLSAVVKKEKIAEYKKNLRYEQRLAYRAHEFMYRVMPDMKNKYGAVLGINAIEIILWEYLVARGIFFIGSRKKGYVYTFMQNAGRCHARFRTLLNYHNIIIHPVVCTKCRHCLQKNEQELYYQQSRALNKMIDCERRIRMPDFVKSGTKSPARIEDIISTYLIIKFLEKQNYVNFLLKK